MLKGLSLQKSISNLHETIEIILKPKSQTNKQIDSN